MAKHRSEVDPKAPIHWVPREEYTAYFDSLEPDDRWTHPQYPDQPMLWHWEERRWWALDEED
jgi:hypothetical protein